MTFTEVIKAAGIERSDSLEQFFKKYNAYIFYNMFYNTGHNRVTVTESELPIVVKLLTVAISKGVTRIYGFPNKHDFPQGTELEILISNEQILPMNFGNTSGINKITFIGAGPHVPILFNSKDLVEVDLSNAKIESIPGSAFARTKIKSIVLPDSVQDITGSTFRDCKDLEYVRLPKDIKNFGQIGYNLFRGCNNLKKVEINRLFLQPKRFEKLKERLGLSNEELSKIEFVRL